MFTFHNQQILIAPSYFSDVIIHTVQTPHLYTSFQGYDLGAFFLKALNDYGKNFEDYLEEIEGSMLQSDLKFKKPTPESGFINQSTRKITYRPDYSIETGSFR